MTRNDALKKRIRARMAETGEPYTDARVALLTAERPPAIDPQLLVPYPHELLLPQPVTTDELGWRILPADATPQQRAAAESYWRPVNPDLPCRCSGIASGIGVDPCRHGTKCDYEDCPGLLWHSDRRAFYSDEPDPLVWLDSYECTAGDELDDVVAPTTVPWAEIVDGHLRPFPDIRRVETLPAEWQCRECGAANQYYCGCREMAADSEAVCQECGATGNYACGCYEE